MIYDRTSAVIDRSTQNQGFVTPGRKAMRHDRSTIETAAMAALATGLLLSSPEIGLGAAIGGTVVGAIAAALALARRRT